MSEIPTLQKRLGAQIRALRVARGLTLRETAQMCDLSPQMLSQIEKDGQNTTIEKLEAILRALGAQANIELEPEEGKSFPSGFALDFVPDAFRSTRAAQEPSDRWGIAQRFLSVLPHLPEDHLNVLVHELALWERLYSPKKRG